MNRTAIRRLFGLVVLLFATQVCAQSASPTFPNPGKTSMSKENQHALGMEVAAQVYTEAPAKVGEYREANPNATRADIIKQGAANRDQLRQRLVNFLSSEQAALGMTEAK